MKTKKLFEPDTRSLLTSCLPKEGSDGNLYYLEEEIARTIKMNADMAASKAKLRDEILVILEGYRDHIGAAKVFRWERDRMQIADAILRYV